MRGAVRAFPPHATIVRQGEKAAAAYLLTQGRAHALLYSVEGHMVLLCEYRPGDLFGALGELDPAPEEAEIVAVEAARSFILKSRDLVALAESYGSIGLALSRLLLRQLRRATSRIYERAAVSAVGRVHAEILRLARASPGLRHPAGAGALRAGGPGLDHPRDRVAGGERARTARLHPPRPRLTDRRRPPEAGRADHMI